MVPKSLRNVSNALAVSLLLSPVALAACSGSETSRLVITQTTDAPAGADHKGHVSPGVFTGITLSIANSGAGAARGVVVEDVLPEGFHYYELTTLGGNAIRTATSDPGSQGNPSWGTWTIPAGTGNTVSALVLSFKVQVPLNPGDYKNQVKITTATGAEIDQGDPVAIVVEPRPSLTLTAAVTSAADVPPQTLGNAAPVSVGKGTKLPITMTVAPTAPYAGQNGTVTYVITVENDSNDAAQWVTVTDTLPQGFAYQSTGSVVINGKSTASRLQPAAGSPTPQWGPFVLPAGGFNGATLVITFTAKINGASLGPHANVVSGNSSNAQMIGGSDQSPVIVPSR